MKNSSLLIAAFVCALIAVGCSKVAKVTEGRTLFDIGYGKSDSSLDVAATVRNDVSITMNKGIWHILSRNEGKILRLSSYGQTLAMWYDPQKGSAPLLLKSVKLSDLSASQQLGRFAIQVHFDDPELIAVDSRQMIYVDDAGTIRRFDSSGAELEPLGKDGLGGSPFSGITSMTVLENDDLAIRTVSESGMEISFFNRAGVFLNKLALKDQNLPTPASLIQKYPSSPGSRIIASLEDEQPSILSGKRSVFLKMNYYFEKSDPQSGVALSVEPIGSWMIVIDAESGEIIDSFSMQSAANDNGIDQQFIAAKSYMIVCVKWASDRLGGEIFCYSPKGKMVGKKNFLVPDKSAELIAFTVGDDRHLYILAQLNSTLRMYSWALPLR